MNKKDFKYGRKAKLRDFRAALVCGTSRTMWKILQKSDIFVVDYHDPKPGRRYATVDFVCRLENGAFSDQIWTCDTRMITTEERWNKEQRLHYPSGGNV